MEKISAWLNKNVKTIEASQPAAQACALMKKHNIGALIVIDKKKRVTGIITERDLVTKVIKDSEDAAKVTVAKIMTKDPIVVSPDDTFKKAYNVMKQQNIRHLPVVKNDKLLGIISLRDFLRFDIRVMEKTINDLQEETMYLRGLLKKTEGDRVKMLQVEVEKLHDLILVDDLTRLYNFKFFRDMILKEIERARLFNHRMTILFIDIDFFKEYNDVNGHQYGNLVLKQIADLLRETSRYTDMHFKLTPVDIVARYGGEEFVIILPETDRQGGVDKSRRLLKAIRDYPFFNKEKQPLGTLTVSIGVAEFPRDASDWEKLIQKADESLYLAKKQGRNKVATCK
jgi:diguanylate cyclase (GGDEF)-like protein